jgi:hypothetical protein
MIVIDTENKIIGGITTKKDLKKHFDKIKNMVVDNE